jgi:hypothetical protein
MMYKREQFYGASGLCRTKSLFRELRDVTKEDASLFTVFKEDRHGKASLYKLYMAYTLNDPSEYTFAETVFGDWKTWDIISNSNMIRDMINEWREANTVRQKSIAIRAIAKEVSEEGKNSFLAAKVLLAAGWKDIPRTKTAKEEEAETTKKAMQAVYDEDAARVFGKGLN